MGNGNGKVPPRESAKESKCLEGIHLEEEEPLTNHLDYLNLKYIYITMVACLRRALL